MKLFNYFNIVKANEEIKSLTDQMENLTKHNDQLKKENESLKQHEATVTLAAQEWMTEKENLIKGNEEAIKALNDKHAEAIKALTEEHAKAIENLNKIVEESKKSAAGEAAKIVASLGVEPETVKLSKEDLASKKSEPKSRFTLTMFNQ